MISWTFQRWVLAGLAFSVTGLGCAAADESTASPATRLEEPFPSNDEIRLTKPWVDDWAKDGRSGLEIVGGQQVERAPVAQVVLAGGVMLISAVLLITGSRSQEHLKFR